MAEERVAIPSGDVQLEGVVETPSGGSGPFPGVVICHPHPLYGGDMDNNVVLAMCRGLVARRIAALRFNFRGVGRSGGAHGGGTVELEDVLAALRALRQREAVDAGRVGLAGYSFGASMALGAAPRDSAVRALAAIAPPMPGLNNPALLAYPHPKLIVAGDLDSFIPIEELRSLVERMAQPAAVETLPGADHFMLGHEGQVARIVGDFFSRHLVA